MEGIGNKTEKILVPRVKGRQSRFMYQVVFPDHGGVKKAFFMLLAKPGRHFFKFQVPLLGLPEIAIIREILHQYRGKRNRMNRSTG